MSQIVYVTSPESSNIYVWRLELNGTLKLLQKLDTPWPGNVIVVHPKKTYLYVSMKENYCIIKYSINDNGLLNRENMTLLPGSTTYLTINDIGTRLYSASYKNNYLTVNSIDKYGTISEVKQIFTGLICCHSANIDTKNKILWAPCLKEDCIRLYKIENSGFLKPNIPEQLNNKKGSGPRHLCFHNKGSYAYILNECMGTINIATTGMFGGHPQIIETIDIIPRNLNTLRWASDIHITYNSKWLYCCERINSIISKFSVSDSGDKLYFLGYQKTENQPRSFHIDTQGSFLIVAGQKSNYLAIYNIDMKSGGLMLINRYYIGKGPTWVVIIEK